MVKKSRHNYFICIFWFSILCSAYGASTLLFRELAPLVDRSWRMEMGGILREEPLPVQFHEFGFVPSKSDAPWGLTLMLLDFMWYFWHVSTWYIDMNFSDSLKIQWENDNIKNVDLSCQWFMLQGVKDSSTYFNKIDFCCG